MRLVARLGLSAAAIALAVGSAGSALSQSAAAPQPAAAATATAPATHARFGAIGLDRTAGDPSIKPGDDFWTYANGGWNRRTEIAADRTSAGFATNLSDEAEQQVRDILTDLAAHPATYGRSGQQVGDMYASWMDTAGIEARGTAPLRPYLARIAAVHDKAGLQVLFATQGYAGPVGFGILPNLADPTHYTAAAGQGSLGMGGRDNYLLPGATYDANRAAYRRYVEQMLTLAGQPDASAKADRIVALETAMARVQWSPAQQRDIAAINNPMTAAQRHELAPQFDWELMLRTAHLSQLPTVIMAEKSAITATGVLLDQTPLDTWKDWMTFRFISDHAQFLPHAFDQANWEFYAHTLNNVPQQRDRWKRGVQLVNGALGEAVGQIYVARHYPPASERQMNELIANLQAAYRDRLTNNTWMDAATRTEALAKLNAFEPRVGHPASYIDYAALQVNRGDLLGNAVRADDFQWDLQLSRMARPVDRSLWEMTPQTVNAYYNPLLNQITFPAAILQPPYFDPNADAAVNYGAIGAIIGHEMGHGFDDQGSQFDGTGRFRNWWTPAARTAFTTRTHALAEQYNGYEGIPGTHINGQLTLGENIGDLGGIETAYAAYHRYLAVHGPAPVIDGLTGDQRFFLSFAQAWQSKIREGALRQRLLTDPHSPPFFRVNGVVRNVDAWYAAFNIQPGDRLYLPPAQRVHIW